MEIKDEIKRYTVDKLWRLALGEDNKIQWTHPTDPNVEILENEPGINWFSRQKLRFLSILPIEYQL